MGKHRAIIEERRAAVVLLGAVATGLTAAALSASGSANATCASISGVGNGNGCTSTPTSFAVGLGSGATASSNGLFDGAIANGTNAQALSGGTFNLAIASGNPTNASPITFASAFGTGNIAVAIGDGAIARANGILPCGCAGTADGVGNTAFAIGTNTQTSAAGNGNFALAAGNPGNNPGIAPGGALIVAPNTTGTQFAEASALGNFNRAISIGNGSTANAWGGDPTSPLGSIGNNTAITVGNGANSYAGEIPVAPLTVNSPNNQFAFAGPGKVAINGINP